MEISANAKINLGLFIKSKRPDGFHEIESVFLPIGWHDMISFEESDRLEFRSSGIEIPSDTKGNLVLQAYALLQKEFDLPPLRIHLEKNVPIGAGLGGGSSDASHMLKALNQYFKLEISPARLQDLALKLGSDCPFFIENKAALARGRGEIFDYNLQLKLAGKLLVVVPPLHISTAEAYSLVMPNSERESLKEIAELPISQWQGKLINDFEAVLCKKYQLLNRLRKQLKDSGAQFVSMSGSGSAFYAIYDQTHAIADFPDDYRTKLIDLST